MSKKHFITLANTIKNTPDLQTTAALNALLNFCEAENPNFDAKRFIKAATGISMPGNRLPSN